MLPQLDEYPAILLKHLQCPQRTPLMAGLEHMLPLSVVFNLVSLVERGSVAVATSVVACSWPSIDDRLLIDT
jgi:hypothetical protein